MAAESPVPGSALISASALGPRAASRGRGLGLRHLPSGLGPEQVSALRAHFSASLLAVVPVPSFPPWQESRRRREGGDKQLQPQAGRHPEAAKEAPLTPDAQVGRLLPVQNCGVQSPVRGALQTTCSVMWGSFPCPGLCRFILQAGQVITCVMYFSDCCGTEHKISSVQPLIVSSSLGPHGLQHARPPCPSPTPRVYSMDGEILGESMQKQGFYSGSSFPSQGVCWLT